MGNTSASARPAGIIDDNPEEVETVIRDHVSVCLKDYEAKLNIKMPKGSKGSAKLRKQIASFCGVKPDSVTRWVSSNTLPQGEIYLKLLCFLTSQGYQVIEFERMSNARRNFTELIGYRIITVNQACEALIYKKKSSLYRILGGDENTTKEKEDIMWEIWKSRKDELTAKKNNLASKQPVIPVSSASGVKPTASRKASVVNSSATIKIMEGLDGLLRSSESKGLSDSELEEFSQAGEIILGLLARLSALSSKVLPRRIGGG